MKIETYIDSGANAHSCKRATYSLDELGLSDEDWSEMTEQEKEDFMRPIIWDTLEWGFFEEE